MAASASLRPDTKLPEITVSPNYVECGQTRAKGTEVRRMGNGRQRRLLTKASPASIAWSGLRDKGGRP